MATNTAALKTFAQETRKKLISLISTKMDFILTQDTAELRGFESQIAKLKSTIASKGKDLVVEEVAYTWFNRVMALRYMDANGYTDLKVVTPGIGQMRPEILQEAMAGNIDEDLRVKVDDNPKEAVLYRRLLVAVCNQYGTTMPFLFEHICDYTEMLLPEDLLSDQSFVTDIRNGMTDEDCQNVEIMGWLYQFYITDRKDDAEKKKSKKGGLKSDEQAAATQLFTPHWVVRYMVENSLGRIWMTLHPESRLTDEMPYYIQTPEGQTDTIPSDIHSVQDIRFIDPCMGSGHVLVYAFDLFCKMYEEEGYQTREIPALILQNNIFGLDIDSRCYQLASFALTMKGRAYYSRYLRKVVEPNVIALQPIDHDTINASGSWGQKSLMWQFENIDTIGSLLKVTPEECAAIHVDSGLFGVRQKLLKTQAEYLSRKYHCVVTNPPYLGKGFGDALKNYLKEHYSNSKSDTMVAFMERLMTFCAEKGKMAMINLPSWMFLGTFEELRKTILTDCHFDSLIHMGRGIFGVDWGSVAFVYSKGRNNNMGQFFRLHQRNFQHIYYHHIGQLFLIVKKDHDFKYDFTKYRDEDVSSIDIFDFKHSANGLQLYFEANQSDFKKIPGNVIGYWLSPIMLSLFEDSKPLSTEARAVAGIQTGDNERFVRFWHEVSKHKLITQDYTPDKKWYPYNKGGSFRKWYGNQELVINWEDNGKELKSFKGATLRNPSLYFKPSISWSLTSSVACGFRYNPNAALFDINGMSLFPSGNGSHHFYLSALNTKVYQRINNIINPTLATQCGDVSRFPAPKHGENEDKVRRLGKENVYISRHDWDSHETSWDFKSNELYRLALGLTYDQVQSSQMSRVRLNLCLEDAVSKYIQYWQEKFMQLHRNEEELNRKFIEIYGLQDELTPDVPLDEITILQKGEISIEDNQIVWHKDVIIKQFISWMVGCFMGRYSADKPGLIIASQGQKVADLDLPAMTLEIDDDGIIPIIQEADFFADDMTQRIEAGVKVLFGERHFYDNMKYIKACLGQELRDYLYKEFYTDHIDGKMYQKRPIYWLFSSKMGDKKKKGYFKALVYMHRMESDTLSKLHADYVSPYIDKVEQQLKEAEDDAVRDDLSQAQRNKANKLATELADKVREVKEFATILAQMSTQRLTIDLDDGVKTNYPKYYPLVEPIKGLESKDE